MATVVALLLPAWLAAYGIARLVPPAAPQHPAAAPLDEAGRGSLQIAAPTQALTFARMPGTAGGPPRLLRVSAYAGGIVHGQDISAALPAGTDPVGAFAALGYDGLAALQGPPVAVAADTLAVPFDGTALQVAAGANYPEHGREVEVDEQFVFPKPTRPGPSRGRIDGRWELLDHEVELGFVALAPLRRGEMPPTMGLVLAGDYTDRAALMRLLRVFDVASGDGFSVAKGEPAFMPVGELFVIPRDLAGFVQSLELTLWHNGRQRQRAEPRLMSWDIARIVDNTFLRAGHVFRGGSAQHRLPVADGVVPARTVFLSGTPEGVVFQGVSLRQRFLGGTELALGLHGWRLQALVEPAIRESIAAGHYLREGDEVLMRAERLGMVVNRIGRPTGPLHGSP